MNKTIRIDIFLPQYIYWYLLALFIWRISIEYLDGIKCLFPISIIISLYIGVIAEADRFLTLQRVFSFFPFFVLGYLTAKKDLKLKLKKIPAVCSILIIAGFEFLVVYFQIKRIIPVKTWENIQCYKSSGLSLMQGVNIRCMSILVGIFITFSLLRIMPDHSSIISNIGSRTDCIYVLSGFGVKFASIIGNHFVTLSALPSYCGLLFSIIMSGIFISLLSNIRIYKVYKNTMSNVTGIVMRA